MRKNISFAIILLLFLTANARAESFNLLQVKYSPWGGIDADEDEFYDSDNYDHYDMSFERGYGARLILKNFYLSIQKNYTDIDQDIPDASVETISVGLALNSKHEINDDLAGYMIFAVGAGSGHFMFKDSVMNDWESFIEMNLELGYVVANIITVGVGVDVQHFGHPGESKATYGSLYLSAGFVF